MLTKSLLHQLVKMTVLSKHKSDYASLTDLNTFQLSQDMTIILNSFHWVLQVLTPNFLSSLLPESLSPWHLLQTPHFHTYIAPTPLLSFDFSGLLLFLRKHDVPVHKENIVNLSSSLIFMHPLGFVLIVNLRHSPSLTYAALTPSLTFRCMFLCSNIIRHSYNSKHHLLNVE